MPIEIERKFLVKKNEWEKLNLPLGTFFRQGYLVEEHGKTIRVRLADQNAWLTIKGKEINGARPEYEYEIPREHAQELLDLFAVSELEKHRFCIDFKDHTWEVDTFLGANQGLIIAEVEMKSANEPVELPLWIDLELTGDHRFSNSNLSKNPIQNWGIEFLNR